MGHSLTQEQLNTIEEIADQHDWQVRGYNGRGMMGSASCLAVYIDAGELFAFGMELAAADSELASTLAGFRCRLDSMGRDSDVAYWPSITVAGTSLDNDDEED